MKIQVGGQNFPKSLEVNAFRAKYQGVHHIGFNCIFINKFFRRFAWWVMFHPHYPPVCISDSYMGTCAFYILCVRYGEKNQIIGQLVFVFNQMCFIFK